MLEQAVSRVLFPRAVARSGAMAIHLASMLPSRSSDLPGNSGGPPSSVSLFGLAPGGVYQAPAVTDRTGELLPHLFTLTPGNSPGAVCFLWHFPSCCQDWALPSTLSYGARTFLPPALRLRAEKQRKRSPMRIPQTECGAAAIWPALTQILYYHTFPFLKIRAFSPI